LDEDPPPPPPPTARTLTEVTPAGGVHEPEEVKTALVMAA